MEKNEYIDRLAEMVSVPKEVLHEIHNTRVKYWNDLFEVYFALYFRKEI